MSRNLSRRQVVRGGGALAAGLLVGCQRDQPPGVVETTGQAAEETGERPTIQTREAQTSGDPTVADLQSLLDRRAQRRSRTATSRRSWPGWTSPTRR